MKFEMAVPTVLLQHSLNTTSTCARYNGDGGRWRLESAVTVAAGVGSDVGDCGSRCTRIILPTLAGGSNVSSPETVLVLIRHSLGSALLSLASWPSAKGAFNPFHSNRVFMIIS